MCGVCGCGDVGRGVLRASTSEPAPGGASLEGLSFQVAATGPLRGEREAHLVKLEHDLLAKNDGLAAQNRARLAKSGALALNLVSSPGAGKTALLERTLQDLKAELPLFVVEGDQETENDALRLRRTGVKTVQVNTGTGCHLDADMVGRAFGRLSQGELPQGELPHGAVVFIENVGNLVCPALFDLGERAKVVVFSVTEGEDKPLKYPHMFRAAELAIVHKVDLLPYVPFDLERAIGHALEVNPGLTVLQVSALTGQGLDAWYGWVRDRQREAQGAHPASGESA